MPALPGWWSAAEGERDERRKTKRAMAIQGMMSRAVRSGEERDGRVRRPGCRTRSVRAVLSAIVLLTASCGTSVTRITPVVDTGTIRGRLSFPGEYLEPQRVVAFDADTLLPVASVDTDGGQSSYALRVPEGNYVVVSYPRDPEMAGLSAGYSWAVPAGLVHGLEDHSLIEVEVEAGSVVTGVDPTDWFAPEGTFPEEP